MIKYVSLNDIKEYENNPRKNEKAIDAVAESISAFGFKNPIIVDKKNVIVAGHTRYKSAQKLGLSEVPIIIADDLTDEQVKAFRIADNKVSDLSMWNNEMLFEELETLKNIDMTLFGFTDDEVSALLNDIPDFVAGTLEEQGDLTKLEPKITKCPHCNQEFDLNEL